MTTAHLFAAVRASGARAQDALARVSGEHMPLHNEPDSDPKKKPFIPEGCSYSR